MSAYWGSAFIHICSFAKNAPHRAPMQSEHDMLLKALMQNQTAADQGRKEQEAQRLVSVGMHACMQSVGAGVAECVPQGPRACVDQWDARVSLRARASGTQAVAHTRVRPGLVRASPSPFGFQACIASTRARRGNAPSAPFELTSLSAHLDAAGGKEATGRACAHQIQVRGYARTTEGKGMGHLALCSQERESNQTQGGAAPRQLWRKLAEKAFPTVENLVRAGTCTQVFR